MNQDKWQKIRKKGKLRYIIMHGLLGWGVTAGLIYAIVNSLVESGFNLVQFFSMEFYMNLSIAMVIFPIVGIFQSYYTWRKNRSFGS